MTSTPRRKLRLNRETIHNLASQPQAVTAIGTSLSHCAFACQTLGFTAE